MALRSAEMVVTVHALTRLNSALGLACFRSELIPQD